MNSFTDYATKILSFLHSRFPEPSEIMMLEVIENFDDKKQCEAFIDTMDFLLRDGYLTYQDSTFGRQLYSMVILTEKGLSFFERKGHQMAK